MLIMSGIPSFLVLYLSFAQSPSCLPLFSMNYRNVVVYWHSYKDAKDSYVLVSESQGQPLNRDLIMRYIRVLVRR